MTASNSSTPHGRRPQLYVVATVHLDTQWRWTVQDTIRDFIPATLERNFALLERYPFFVVSFEGAFRYQLMKEYYPEQFEKLRAWVTAGRWRLAGSMLDAPDVNAVAPESLIRHILYGNGFFEKEFGRRSCDLFLPDCFGFGQVLPSVAAHCGLIGFSGQKFGRWMAPATIPFDVGVWQGPDGGEIVAAIRPEGYGEGLDEDLSQAPRFLDRLTATGELCGAAVGIKYVGVGDRGGGLDEESMQWLDKSIHEDGPVRVILSGSDQIFRDLSNDQIAAMPRHTDELLLPTHGTGCLTSQAQLKRWNRRNEQLADAAERAAAMADIWVGLPYPTALLRQAWTRFLWHQMHDDLTGTSIPEAYRFTDNDELLSLNQFAAVLTHSVGAVAATMDTRGQGQPIAVFNPLSVERQDVVTIDVPNDVAPQTPVSVRGPDGREVPAQLTMQRDGARAVIFLATTPPLGLQIYDLRIGVASELDLRSSLQVSSERMANDRYEVRIDRQGDVETVFDRRTGRHLLDSPIRLQLIRDRSARWPAWEILYEDLLESEPEVVAGPAEVRILEEGPVRVALSITRSSRRSTYHQIVRLAAGGAGDFVEIRNQVDWHTRGRLLKARFSLSRSNPLAIFDLGLGTIQRGDRRREKYEVPAQQWVAMTAQGGSGGATILNDCKYGWDKPDDHTLRLSLLRSPRVIRKFRHQGTQDHGRHRFTLGLAGHDEDWRPSNSSWQAARLNQPLLAFRTSAHTGRLGRELSLLEVGSDQIALQALKRAESGSGWIARLRELSGSKTEEPVILRLSDPLQKAVRVNGMEEEIAPAALEAAGLITEFEPFELHSYAIEVDPPAESSTTRAPSQAIAIPFDRLATRRRGQQDDDGFDGQGHSLPAELFPERLAYGGIEYVLGPSAGQGLNTLSCRGQSLALGEHEFSRVHLLATSTVGTALGSFGFGDSSAKLEVPYYSRMLGRQWKRRSLFGAIRSPTPTRLGDDQEVAWVATHRLDSQGEPEPYVFCILFHFALTIPRGVPTIELPEEPRIHLFAVTLSDSLVGDTRPAHALYD